MGKYKRVKLKEIAKIESGGTPSRKKKEYWENGNIPWVKIGDIDSKYLSKVGEYITQKGFENSSTKLFSKNTILYTIFATIGEVSILNIDACTNQAIVGININSNTAIIEYVYYYLRSLKDKMREISRGVAQNNINMSILKDIEVPLPSMEIQKKIVDRLDKAQELIDKRKQQIEKYDEFLQSLFLDMFGDPVSNPKGWKKKKISDFLLSIDSGWSPKCNENIRESSEYWGVLKLSSVTGGVYNAEKHKELPSNLNIRKDLEVKTGDLLFTRKNTLELVGDCAYVFWTPPKLIFSDLIFRLKLKNNIDKIFLWKLFRNKSFKNIISSLAGGSAISMSNISKSKLKDLKIIYPDLKLQNKFSEIVKKIEKMKEREEKNLKIMEENFNSINSRIFN